MTQEHKSVSEMWNRYLKTFNNSFNVNRSYISWHFCDNEDDANSLAELVKQGVKRATTGLYYFYELEDEELPKEGDISIITDWQGKAQCIIETKKVTLVPFKEVTEDFAKTEGEGDKSLKYWREVHTSVYNRRLKELNMEFSEDMLVVCEEFEVVYK